MLDKMLGLQEPTFGLDIGYDSVKVFFSKKRGQEFTVGGFGAAAIPAGCLAKNGISQKEKVVEAITSVCAQAKPHAINLKAVVTALPEHLVFTKILEVAKAKPAELSQAIPFEAAEFFPLPIEETNLDWQIIRELPDQGKVEVLVVAAPKNLVNELIDLARLARLNILSVETKPIAIVRAILKKREQVGFLIVDIGAQSSGLAVVDEGALHLTGTVNFGSNLINNNFKTLKPEEAEKVKREIGFNPKGHPKESEIIRQTLVPLADAITKAIKYYHNRIKAKAKIEEVRLCGGGANMPGIEILLTKETGFKTVLTNPLVNFSGKIPEALNLAEARRLTAAIGLSLKE